MRLEDQKMHVPDEQEANKLDFSWGCFYVRYVLGPEDRITENGKKGIQPTFLLVDHQQGRLTNR